MYDSATQPITQAAAVSAFIGGINAAESLANMQPHEMVSAINLDISAEGLTVRKGNHEYCYPIADAGGIRTIIPYTAAAIGSGDNRLFITGVEGIYDATVNGGVPELKAAFVGGASERAGYGSWSNFVDVNGDQVMLLCDLVNGYWFYDPALDVGGMTGWTKVDTEVTGADPADFNFVNVWKGRCFFVEKDSTRCWYTGPAAYLGAVTALDFGNKFKYGGFLKGVFNYSLDGGDGPDDYLVAVSEAGDVLIYQGTNPDTTVTWALVGSFYIGPVPRGRRIATEHGGDLLLLSYYGVTSVSKLLAGVGSLPDSAVTFKIEPLVNRRMASTISLFGWELKFIPTGQKILLLSPKGANPLDNQYVYNTTLKAWTVWAVKGAVTYETWDTQVFMGSSDGRLFLNSGDQDNVLLPHDNPPEPAAPIEWYFLSSFQDMGSPANYKRVQLMRPEFLSQVAPSYSIEARYDYDLTPVTAPPSSPGSAPTGTLWDPNPVSGDPPSGPEYGQWDVSFWGGRAGAYADINGGKGIGRSIAISMSGLSAAETSVISVDIMWDTGGYL